MTAFVVIILAFIVAAVEPRWVKNKTELYQQYPQLINQETRDKHPCVMGMSRYLLNVYDDNHQDMWQSSVKYLTDMGDKARCENLKDEQGNQIGQFVIMNTNVTHIRGKARQGVCLPIECTQEQITWASDLEVNFINYGIRQLPEYGINIDILIFKTGLSQVYDKFIISDQRDQELRDQT